MNKYIITIGLNDKDTLKQELETWEAKKLIARTCLNNGIEAFTMLECQGVYKMQSNGEIVCENSIRLEICSDHGIKRTISRLCDLLKTDLNQESIMLECSTANIDFV
jgi:hypothetical protein